MVKHTQTIRRQIADELFQRVRHFVGLALKELSQSILHGSPSHSHTKTSHRPKWQKKYETGFWMNFHLNSIVVDTWNE